jgi:hypothetical protein
MPHARLVVVLAVLAGAVVGAVGVEAAPASVSIQILSNRADLVSGGDALTAVTVTRGQLSDVSVTLNGADVTRAFTPRNSARMVGLVTGLRDGANELVAVRRDGRGARLVITNHPSAGPIFSGPHLRPWLCTTAANGLGDPTDPTTCAARTKVEYFYQSTAAPTFLAYDPDNPPADVKTITTDQGKAVPYIIRQETGTQDRGIYRFAVLWDPAKPAAKQIAWNHKLYYLFGVSCGTLYSQGTAVNVQNAASLQRGFMVASSSLNTLGTNCNTVLSAEAMMMLKEHIVDRYGEIRYTFGSGASGGSIGQNMVANSYPGLLQGITESSTFTDTYSTLSEVLDCHLLMQYYSGASQWNTAAMAAVDGHGASPATCEGWEQNLSQVENPSNGTGLPAEQSYNAKTNPAGARGRVEDLEQNVWGLRPPTLWTAPEKAIGRGFARGSFDNEGVQYGLTALRDGQITAEQFVDLNEKIGGMDVDMNPTPQRSVRDPGAGVIEYTAGRINDGRYLDDVAMIDFRTYGNLDAYTIHTMYHSFSMKERIRRANGNADNHVVWRGGAGPEAFDVMDAWLSAVEKDRRGGTPAKKLTRNRPPGAHDACSVGQLAISNDEATCDTVWPYYGNPRIAAGGPLANDIMKCRLKPLDRKDPAYGGVVFTDAQWERLRAALPTGVCDWSQPGVDQQPSRPWMTYAGGPGTGLPLPPPPVSEPV